MRLRQQGGVDARALSLVFLVAFVVAALFIIIFYFFFHHDKHHDASACWSKLLVPFLLPGLLCLGRNAGLLLGSGKLCATQGLQPLLALRLFAVLLLFHLLLLLDVALLLRKHRELRRHSSSGW